MADLFGYAYAQADTYTGPRRWNYARRESVVENTGQLVPRDDFSLVLVGTIVAVQRYQRTAYTPSGDGKPEFWPDGRPKMDIRVLFSTSQPGGLKWISFMPNTSRKDRASWAALEAAGQTPPATSRYLHANIMSAIKQAGGIASIGRTLRIETWDPPVLYDQQGNAVQQEWGRGNPRPFTVQDVTDQVGIVQVTEDIPEEFTREEYLQPIEPPEGYVQAPQPPPQPPLKPPVYQQPPVQPAQVQPVQPAQVQPVQPAPQQPAGPAQPPAQQQAPMQQPQPAAQPQAGSEAYGPGAPGDSRTQQFMADMAAGKVPF